jgi:hypothetical protein
MKIDRRKFVYSSLMAGAGLMKPTGKQLKVRLCNSDVLKQLFNLLIIFTYETKKISVQCTLKPSCS